MTDRFDCSPSESLVDQSDAAPALLSRRSSGMGPSKLSDAAPTFDMSAFAVDGVYDRKLAMDELDDWLNNTGFEDKMGSERRSYVPQQSRGITRGEAHPSSEPHQLRPSRSDRGRPQKNEDRISDRRVSVDELDNWLHGTCFGEEIESGRRLTVPDITATSRGVKRRRVARRNKSVSAEMTEADFCRQSRPKKPKLKSAVPMYVPLEASGFGVRAPVENAPKPVFCEFDKQTYSRYFLGGVMAERDAYVLPPQVRRDWQAPANTEWLSRPQVSPLQRHPSEHPRQLLYKTGQDVLGQDQVCQRYLQTHHRSMQGSPSGGHGQTQRARRCTLKGDSGAGSAIFLDNIWNSVHLSF
mmetsp:Transcript_30830/g.69178  ORF Transcript_30830/g.69178 Transcript_30830/m.69178 type:complete len:354 (-) Transcript_30830:739-1800(-)